MWLLLSGEGVSDMGVCNQAMDYCEPPDFKSGPMAWFVDQCVEQQLCYSHIEAMLVRFIAETRLTALSKSLAKKKKLKLPGVKRKRETLYYQRNARALAIEAQKMERELADGVIAVLFRDADGTQSSGRGEWRAKWESMINGFIEEGFDRGVPMIPKPKSEAWLLCAVKEHPYQHCAALENESGNDNSPNSLKSQLNTAMNGQTSAFGLVEKVVNKEIDVSKIEMPSLQEFKDRLTEVLESL